MASWHLDPDVLTLYGALRQCNHRWAWFLWLLFNLPNCADTEIWCLSPLKCHTSHIHSKFPIVRLPEQKVQARIEGNRAWSG